jgi:hypothetical protein
MSRKNQAKMARLAPRSGVPRLSPAEPQRPIELPDGMWDRIARKAYQLWDERGQRVGNDLADWLDAETAVMEEIHEARE